MRIILAITMSSLLLICFTEKIDSKFVDSIPTTNLQGCPANPDQLYDRQKLLEKFQNILKESVPNYDEYSLIWHDFFVYDLNEPTNKYTSQKDCINFINNHIYHFSIPYYPYSQSHIAILQDGDIKIFKSVNCKDSRDKLEEVVKYVEERKLVNEEVLIRLKNYRRYGWYFTDDQEVLICSEKEKITENTDKSLRVKLLKELSEILYSSISKKLKDYYYPYHFLPKYAFVESGRGNGFFIYDLTEPTNKQTSLTERVEFKNNHIYHFAYIDLPFSFSHLVILENGKLRVFRGLNCRDSGDNLEEVVQYLSEKLKDDERRDEIIERVKNYRKYGTYASFKGISRPQCEEFVRTE